MSAITVGEDEGRLALLIDGVVQSVAVGSDPPTVGYWPSMLPEACPKGALLLGLGGGTIATLLNRRFGHVAITAVEREPEVVRLAQTVFGLSPTDVNIVLADAFEFAAADEGRYDYIAVDLFDGEGVPRRIFGRPFLRTLKRLVTPGGLVAINFFKDRRLGDHQRRLETVFPRVSTIIREKNVVARCRPR